ncbi:triosephosphate isomerase [Vairimorpha ceranae]|uniref:Triosephosphate isomerase n=1 Tax=Vairimorpha ceranae TaxID=40302 RepID=A0A0F9YT25_9MICR|nr:triosephosphate isomerase [Vairimorpha ceranae]KAF5140641.1 hypothetical protein G9O61_00g011370 [Vairimorpha ceranae]KKO75707.1 triosephosphate isomerase [Vairimorpha ceranae]
MKPIVVGNWKANKNFEVFNKIPSNLNNIEVAIALPHIYIPQTVNYSKHHISISGQDCSKFESGPYTGETPSSFLKENHAKYVIIGHSERRRYFYENSSDFTTKINNALAAGLGVIYCIGENSLERESNEYMKVLYDQFFSVVGQGIKIDIAYEPVWAIGSGIIPKKEEISEVIEHIQRWSRSINVSGRILYGGSVSYDNIELLHSINKLKGFLIGGISLKTEFVDICEKYNSLNGQ